MIQQHEDTHDIIKWEESVLFFTILSGTLIALQMMNDKPSHKSPPFNCMPREFRKDDENNACIKATPNFPLG